jgi:uncharacterized membrane protein YeiB
MGGLDLARAIAMLGMVIAHYAVFDRSGSNIDRLVSVTHGRAMPLFVLLGGIGATIVAGRAANPDRTLLARAAVLYPAGLLLQEATTFIVIILSYYALFFALAPVLRRLPTPALGLTGIFVWMVGTVTSRSELAALPRFDGPSHYLTDPVEAAAGSLSALIATGHYPLFPVGAFFIAGMLVGRLDLGRGRVQAALLGGGVVVGLAVIAIGDRVMNAASPAERQAALDDNGEFVWRAMFDTTGHTGMAAWMLSAVGTSLAVVGASLLLVDRAPQPALVPLAPIMALGRMALTFYVVQALIIHLVPHPLSTSIEQGLATALIIYIGFIPIAALWLHLFDRGPFEWLLRRLAPL